LLPVVEYSKAEYRNHLAQEFFGTFGLDTSQEELFGLLDQRFILEENIK